MDTTILLLAMALGAYGCLAGWFALRHHATHPFKWFMISFLLGPFGLCFAILRITHSGESGERAPKPAQAPKPAKVEQAKAPKPAKVKQAKEPKAAKVKQAKEPKAKKAKRRKPPTKFYCHTCTDNTRHDPETAACKKCGTFNPDYAALVQHLEEEAAAPAPVPTGEEAALTGMPAPTMDDVEAAALTQSPELLKGIDAAEAQIAAGTMTPLDEALLIIEEENILAEEWTPPATLSVDSPPFGASVGSEELPAPEPDKKERKKKVPKQPSFGHVKYFCPSCEKDTPHDKHGVCVFCKEENKELLAAWGGETEQPEVPTAPRILPPLETTLVAPAEDEAGIMVDLSEDEGSDDTPPASSPA